MKQPTMPHSESGFTLVELLITMVISGVIMAAVYAAYTVNQKVYTEQQHVVYMQQNIRASLQVLGREIRMAGYNPAGGSGSGIVDALPGSVRFAMDLNEDGDVTDTDEDVSYQLYVAGDGIKKLGRKDHTPPPPPPPASPPVNQAVAEHIDAIEFYYTLVKKVGGAVTVSQKLNPTAAELSEIQAVTMSILARAAYPDPKFTNTMTYQTASGAAWGPYNDNLRRRLLVTTVQCRNMGL